MRWTALLFVAIVCVAAQASATNATVPVANVAGVHVRDVGSFLAWPPMPSADAYLIYRLEPDGHEILLGRTPLTTFFDAAVDGPEVPQYRVDAVGVQLGLPQTRSGEGACVTTGAPGQASVTLSQCYAAATGSPP